MENFDLRKYLAEGKLLKENINMILKPVAVAHASFSRKQQRYIQ